MEFSGKSVIVTGAGKGIGRATAKMLAARGAEVIALSRSQADLDSLASEIGCRGIAVDLADAAATRQAALEALPADLLVNCAGTTALDPFLDVTAETFDMIYAVNTRAPMIVAQEYARDRVAKGVPGAIVNVSSMASFFGIPDHAAYCASKGGLDALTRVMANELGRHGIRVNAVNPTVTLTPMAVKAWSDPAKAGGMLSRIPVGHFADPDEVAEVILFLLTDRASMMNGVAMPVDGGFMVT
ncbi:NAD(P)-dependent dehydrogenase, short-chain alcohol dehydrogenase family [Kaistia soli DSM 19436]|uniref:NAD(P)-dependent dehydrogenase, short-chain alcohol dehydrogenase family n=1 Tax=Kaistia soli DSM 19436 TaxID=1122133 RepID=A0A1M4YPY3_9HYPH|nr:SDR family oxidoreductase [Kaistia soli]SHF07562.1 NAD(P)-dependent dehydrogenase, short-chain alcohol dehydrogenase family [Kaistia soli DSM 19436]